MFGRRGRKYGPVSGHKLTYAHSLQRVISGYPCSEVQRQYLRVSDHDIREIVCTFSYNMYPTRVGKACVFCRFSGSQAGWNTRANGETRLSELSAD